MGSGLVSYGYLGIENEDWGRGAGAGAELGIRARRSSAGMERRVRRSVSIQNDRGTQLKSDFNLRTACNKCINPYKSRCLLPSVASSYLVP